MTVISNPLLLKKKAAAGGGGGGGSAYQIEKSLRFNSADSAYLKKTDKGSGNGRVWTLSYWIKRTKLGTWQWNVVQHHSGNAELIIGFRNDDTFGAQINTTSHGRKTTAVFKDTSAFYHFTIVCNTPDAATDERLKIFCNGVRVDDTDGDGSAISQNEVLPFNQGRRFDIGSYQSGATYSDGYFSDVHFIDGLALSPAAFGSFDSTGVWNPKAFALPAPNANTTWSTHPGSQSGVGFDALDGDGFHNNHPATYAFNGNLSNKAGTATSGAGKGLSFVPPTAFEGVSTLRFYGESVGANMKFRIHDGTSWGAYHKDNDSIWNGSNTAWRDISAFIPANRKVEKFEYTSEAGGHAFIGAIEVDGAILVDGQTDPTTRTNPNNGTTWSSSVTLSTGAWDGGDDPGSGFDGSFGTAAENGTAHAVISFDPPGGISYEHKIEVWGGYGQWRINSGSWSGNGTLNGNAWTTLTTGSGTLNKLEIKGTDADGWAKITVLKIDGHILVDSSVDNSFHLKFNDTSLNRYLGKDTLNGKIANATGGKPIYVTSDDYGDVKGSGYNDEASNTIRDALVLAIPGDSVASGTCDVHQQVNTGSSNKTATTAGLTSNADQSRFYGSALKFDGSTSNLSFADSADFDLAGGNFTIELWLRPTDSPSQPHIIGQWINPYHWALQLSNDANRKLRFLTNDAAALLDKVSTGPSLALNHWNHVAIVRNSNTITFYLDGAVNYSYAYSNTINNGSEALNIGSISNSGIFHGFKGGMQDIRIYKGVAKYTAAFTPPTRNDFTVNNLTNTAVDAPLSTLTGGMSKVGTASDDSNWNSFDRCFDGSTSTGYSINPASQNDYIRWTPATTRTAQKVAMSTGTNSNTQGTLTVNYGSNQTATLDIPTSVNGTQWSEKDLGSTQTINWVELKKANTTGGSAINLHAIRLDSTVVVATSTADIDSLTDSPTNYGTDAGAGGEVRGNYATLNPLAKGMDCTLSQGNLHFAYGTSTDLSPTPATLGMPKGSGKWYWEVEVTEAGQWCHGIVNTSVNHSTSSGIGTGYYIGHNTTGWGVNAWGQGVTYNNATSQANYLGTGDISSSFTGHLGFAFDADNGNLWVRKDGTWGASATTTEVVNGTTTNAASSTITVGESIFWFPAVSDGSGSSSDTQGYINFGQRAFKHAAPTGFKCLCTANLDDTFSGEAAGTVNNPSKYFNIITYQGTGASKTFTGLGFGPDMIWTKQRSSTGEPRIQDRVRGTNSQIRTNTNAAEMTETNNVTAFGSDGYTIGANGDINSSSHTHVAWLWDAGTAEVTPSSSYDITPDKQWVNTTAGFSITKYEGNGTADQRIPHGQAVKPDFAVIKKITASGNGGSWMTKHVGLSANNIVTLDNPEGQNADSGWYGIFKDHPDQVTVKVSTNNDNRHTNEDGMDYILYAWTAIPGYSAFGAYEGNASTNGSFVYCGFQPRFILIKNIDDGQNWHIYDTERNPSNVTNYYLFPNLDNGGYSNEGSNDDRRLDILSNGFKLRETAYINSAHTHIYAAFAEHPFKLSRAR